LSHFSVFPDVAVLCGGYAGCCQEKDSAGQEEEREGRDGERSGDLAEKKNRDGKIFDDEVESHLVEENRNVGRFDDLVGSHLVEEYDDQSVEGIGIENGEGWVEDGGVGVELKSQSEDNSTGL